MARYGDGRKSKMIRVPLEFDNFLKDLSKQESIENGDAPSKARVMRLITTQYKDKLVFKGKKIDIKLF